MSAKHTSGPWLMLGRTTTLFGEPAEAVGTADIVVAAINPYASSIGNSKDRYNAYLIAAAPELLEALESAVSLAIQLGAIKEIDEYLRIIAKAKGEA